MEKFNTPKMNVIALDGDVIASSMCPTYDPVCPSKCAGVCSDCPNFGV